jgi:hypothetical protein
MPKLEGAWHSVIGVDGRESDIEATWLTADGRRAILLIEDKIDAQCQPDQAVAYGRRAGDYVREGSVHMAATVLIAPAGYSDRFPQDTAPFNAVIAIDDIRGWVTEHEGLASRRQYVGDLLSHILAKAHRARARKAFSAAERQGHDGRKPQFPEAYAVIRRELARGFPNLTITNASDGEWVYFGFAGKRHGVSARYRLRDHWVELILPRKAFDEAVVRSVVSADPLVGGLLAERGSTELAYWLPTPEIDLDADVNNQSDRIRAGLAAASTLATWFAEHVAKLKGELPPVGWTPS